MGRQRAAARSACSRRRVVALLARAGAGTALGAAFGACGGRKSPDPAATRAEARRREDDLDCTDTSGLFPAERMRRTANEYADRSPKPPQYCFNCQYWVPADRSGECGECANVPGPIHPLGWCKIWIYDWRGDPARV
jgi:hypothetical protein